MTTLGKLSGTLGLLLLLTTPLSYILQTGEGALLAVKAIVGALFLVFFLATHFRSWVGPPPNRAPKISKASFRPKFFYLSSTLMFFFVIVGLAALNAIAHQRNKTWDFTRKQIHSLSPQTISVLQSQTSSVKVIAFFPSTHPNYSDVEALLEKYSAVTPFFTYDFLDPRKYPELASKYKIKSGETPVVLTQGDAHLSLDILSEQALTNALRRLGYVKKNKIYLLVGHGEWSVERMSGKTGPSMSEFYQSLLQEGYSLESLSLVEVSEVPQDAAVVLIAGAKTPLMEKEKQLLSSYMEEGGRIFYFAEVHDEPGLDGLLSDYAIQVDNGVVADDQINPRNPYEIVARIYADHPTTSLLKQLQYHTVFPSVRCLSILRTGFLQGVKSEPLVLTFPSAWVETTPDGLPKLTDGEKSGALPLAAVSTRDTAQASSKRFEEARLIAIGDSELLLNTQWGQEGNRNLVLNSLAWLSSQDSLLTIRPPDRDISTVEISDEGLMHLRFSTMDLLPLGLMGLGLSIWMVRRNQ